PWPYTQGILQVLWRRLRVSYKTKPWTAWIHWCAHVLRGTSDVSRHRGAMIASAYYEILVERNKKVFGRGKLELGQLVGKVIREVQF
ncbi:hypothetical protein Ancab_015306, partial [Ancistrocladus abbreviatus]